MRYEYLILSLVIGLLGVGIASGDWLTESPPNYGELRQYFSDPIFYSSPSARVNEPYYPYFGRDFFRDPVQPIRLGKVGFVDPGRLVNYPSSPYESEFRNKSLASLQWPDFKKNWTATVEFVKTRSSVRVFQDGEWRVVQI